jgi:4-hydroxy-3-methylbut-2-enyl diphosphate reductase IspH
MKDYHIIFIGHKNHEEAEEQQVSIISTTKLKDQNEKAGNTYIISSKMMLKYYK